jgi:hypothetical protein
MDIAALPATMGASAEELSSSLYDAQTSSMQSRRSKYPSVTVYLPPRAIRIIKEIGLDENRRLSDLLAEAVDEWLVKRGHPSITQLRE